MIELKHVQYAYGTNGNSSPLFLNSISFSLSQGDLLAVRGRNGSGKSTLLRIVASILSPTSGSIHLNGRPLTHQLKAFRSVLNYSAGGPLGFYPRLSGLDNLRFFSALKGRLISQKEGAYRMSEVGLLESDHKKYFNSYSLGMRQRLHLARSFLEPFEYLILDEPTNGLDSEGVEIAEHLLNHRSRSAAVIMTSHNADLLGRLSNRTFDLQEGKPI